MAVLEPLEHKEVDYEGQLTPQVVESLPAPQIFVLAGPVAAFLIITSTTNPTFVRDPITKKISLTLICAMSGIGFNLRMKPTKKVEEPLIMLSGREANWSINPVL